MVIVHACVSMETGGLGTYVYLWRQLVTMHVCLFMETDGHSTYVCVYGGR